jgi:hypothetical protein
LAVAVLIAASGHDFTAIGHALALTLGVLLAMRFRADTRWTPTQLVVLAVGVVFGYVMLAGSSRMTAPIVGVAGALIALTSRWVVRRWGPAVLSWRSATPGLVSAMIMRGRSAAARASLSATVNRSGRLARKAGMPQPRASAS